MILANYYRWLYSHGRQKEAIDELSRLFALPIDHPNVQTVVAEMEEALALEHNNHKAPTFRGIFLEKSEIKNPRRLALCFLLQFFQQFTGINVIAFYGEIQRFS